MRVPPSDNKKRFTNRVPFYHASRPRYPEAVLTTMREHMGLASHHLIADIGSGTGISSELFLNNGNEVFAIEPNDAMRAVSQQEYGHNPRFHAIGASAEATTLPDHHVDFAVAGQAFHWFNIAETRTELQRILKPNGYVMLFWNMRHDEDSALQMAYNRMMQEFDTEGKGEFRQTAGQREADDLDQFFGVGRWQETTLPNSQTLDFEGFRSRVLSASYIPLEGEPRFEELMHVVHQVFEAHQTNGTVTLLYRTGLYWGQFA